MDTGLSRELFVLIQAAQTLTDSLTDRFIIA